MDIMDNMLMFIMDIFSLFCFLATDIYVMELLPLSVQVLEKVSVVLGQEVLCSDGEERDGETKYEADTCRAKSSQQSVRG